MEGGEKLSVFFSSVLNKRYASLVLSEKKNRKLISFLCSFFFLASASSTVSDVVIVIVCFLEKRIPFVVVAAFSSEITDEFPSHLRASSIGIRFLFRGRDQQNLKFLCKFLLFIYCSFYNNLLLYLSFIQSFWRICVKL
jgi:hypothetical protein